MPLLIHKNGRRGKLTDEDRKKLELLAMKNSIRQEKAEKARMKRVRIFNRTMREKYGRRRLKCCDSCDKLFVIKIIKEAETMKGSERGDYYIVKISTTRCPYCKNEVDLKEEYLRSIPPPILVYPI